MNVYVSKGRFVLNVFYFYIYFLDFELYMIFFIILKFGFLIN